MQASCPLNNTTRLAEDHTAQCGEGAAPPYTHLSLIPSSSQSEVLLESSIDKTTKALADPNGSSLTSPSEDNIYYRLSSYWSKPIMSPSPSYPSYQPCEMKKAGALIHFFPSKIFEGRGGKKKGIHCIKPWAPIIKCVKGLANCAHRFNNPFSQYGILWSN